MEVLMNENDDRLLKRFTAIKKLDYYIEESVYYRTHFGDINLSSRNVLWTSSDNNDTINDHEN